MSLATVMNWLRWPKHVAPARLPEPARGWIEYFEPGVIEFRTGRRPEKLEDVATGHVILRFPLPLQPAYAAFVEEPGVWTWARCRSLDDKYRVDMSPEDLKLTSQHLGRGDYIMLQHFDLERA